MRIPPLRVYTLAQIARLMGDTVFKAELWLRSNHVPIERRGRTRVVRHTAIEQRWPDVADAIRFGGDDE